MKLSAILSCLFLMSITINQSFGQNRSKAFSEQSVVWYGVDYSLSKFILVPENSNIIVNKYIPSINELILMEQAKKYNIKRFFNKTDVTFATSNVKERNSKINPETLVVENPINISIDDIKKHINSYETEGRTGLGLVFVAENLNKTTNHGSYYVVFFDQETKEIIDAQHMFGKALGIGFRNFWAASVCDIMKQWAKQ